MTPSAEARCRGITQLVQSGSADPVSPLGQAYRAFIRRTDGGAYEVAVMPLGAPLAGFAARAGITAETESLRVWNVAVMQEIRSKFTLPAGVINQGSSTIDSAASGFTLDLGAFLGGNASQMTIAALSNFAQLETLIDDVPQTPDSFVGKACQFRFAECEAGETKAAAVTPCERWGAEFVRNSALTETVVTPAGSVSLLRSLSSATRTNFQFATTAPGPRTYSITTNPDQSLTCRLNGTTFEWSCCGPGNAGFCLGQEPLVGSQVRSIAMPAGNLDNRPFAWIQTPRELNLWSDETIRWESAERTTSKPMCSGSNAQLPVRVVPTPIWTARVTRSGRFGIMLQPLDGATANIASLAEPTFNPGSGLNEAVFSASFQEVVRAPGVDRTFQCSNARISSTSNGRNVTLAVPSVWPPVEGIGTNNCPANVAPGVVGAVETFEARHQQPYQALNVCCR